MSTVIATVAPMQQRAMKKLFSLRGTESMVLHTSGNFIGGGGSAASTTGDGSGAIFFFLGPEPYGASIISLMFPPSSTTIKSISMVIPSPWRSVHAKI